MNTNKAKSVYKIISRFFHDRFLPHPVRIALLGDKGSGKTTLLRTIIEFGTVGKTFDEAAADRMDKNVPDQETVELPCRVYGHHGFRDFLVKDYRGDHFLSTQFRSRVLKGAEGVVVLVRGSRLLEDSKEARESKRRYLDACSSVEGVRAAVLLETDSQTTGETSRKAMDALLDEMRKTLVDAGVPENAVRRYRFDIPPESASPDKGPSRKDRRNAAERAAEPFLWLSEQLDKTIWTWIRTRWWTWMLLVVLLSVFAAAGILRGCDKPPPDGGLQGEIAEWKGVLRANVPKDHTWSEWKEERTGLEELLEWERFEDALRNNGKFAAFVEERKTKNDRLAIELLAEETKKNVDWLSVVGKADPEIVSFGQRLDGFKPLSSQFKNPVARLREEWSKAVQAELRDDSPASEIKRTHRLLTASRSTPTQRDEATQKRKQALESMLGQILERFDRETNEPPVADNGLPRSAARLASSMFPNETEDWKNKISAHRKRLVEEQIEEWRKSQDLKANRKDVAPEPARLLQQKYAPFARNHSDNPNLRLATEYVAGIVGTKLVELTKALDTCLKDGDPKERTLNAGANALKELQSLCRAIRNPMVQKTPFGARWESRFADDFMNKASTKDEMGVEHPREFLEMFWWRLTVSEIKIRVVNSTDEYWVSLEADTKRKWDVDLKRLVDDKSAKPAWIVPRPGGFEKMGRLNQSNVGPKGIDLPVGKAGILSGNPFDAPSLFLYVCRKGEKAKNLRKWKGRISVNGAEPFFTNTDDKGRKCRAFSCDIDKKTKVQFWLYGTESAIRPLQMLEEAKHAGAAP